MFAIKEINDLVNAEALWRLLSPGKTIFDTWDFRYCFYKYFPYPLNFYAAYEKRDGEEKPVALLPLERHKSGWLEFFAEDPCEENRLFLRPGYERIIPRLYRRLPKPVIIYDISGEDTFTRALPLEDYKYVLPLNGLRTFNDYARRRLSTKKQHNWRSEFKRLEAGGLKIIYNRWPDLKKLFKLNVINFSDSYLQSKEDQQAWSDLIRLPFNWQLVSLEVKGRLAAVALAVLFNKIYFYLISGADSKTIPSLGKYLNKITLEQALSLGAEVWDVGLGDCGWKEAWHLDRISQHQFIRQ